MSEETMVGPVDGALHVSGIRQLGRSVEAARLWVEDQGPATCIINPHRLKSPGMFGMLLVDCARHGARAYAAAHGLTEGEALEQIWEALDAERDRHTTDLTTVQKSGAPH